MAPVSYLIFLSSSWEAWSELEGFKMVAFVKYRAGVHGWKGDWTVSGHRCCEDSGSW